MRIESISSQAKKARLNGKKRFTSSKPCGACGGVEFYSSGRGVCISCNKKRMDAFRSTPEGLKKMSEYTKKSVQKRRERSDEINNQLTEYNRKYCRKWRATKRGREYQLEYNRKWNRNNYLNVTVRRCMRRMMLSLSKEKGDGHISSIVGYSNDEFINKMLETAPSMDSIFSGEYHVDHILPIKWFLKQGITDQKLINSLKNLQAIKMEENLSKGCKWLMCNKTEWQWCYELQISVYGEIRYKEGG